MFSYLIYAGVPPLVVLQLSALSLQVLLFKNALMYRYAMEAQMRKQKEWSAGDHYRHYLKSGGARP